MYTDLIFDLYGTLLDIHTEEDRRVWEKTALFFGFCGAPCSPEDLRSRFQSALAGREAQAGQDYECYPDIPMEEIFDQLFSDLGLTEGTRALAEQAARLFRISSIEYIRLYPNVIAALKRLRSRGYRLWLLSNAQAVFTRCELRMVGLEGVFDGVYLSSDYQCRKPDPRFYRALLDGQGLMPEKCLMIGNDRDTDIAGAQALGMATLYLHTNLTPSTQAPADPRHYPAWDHLGPNWEFEGEDWQELASILEDWQ